MIERHAGDANAEIGHVGEVGQAHAAELVGLPEDDVLLSAMGRPPRADAALDRAPDAFSEIWVAADHLGEDRDRPGAAFSIGTISVSNRSPSGFGRRRPRTPFYIDGRRGSPAGGTPWRC